MRGLLYDYFGCIETYPKLLMIIFRDISNLNVTNSAQLAEKLRDKTWEKY